MRMTLALCMVGPAVRLRAMHNTTRVLGLLTLAVGVACRSAAHTSPPRPSATVGSPAPVTPDSVPLVFTDPPRPSTSVPAGQLHGVVLDRYRATPIRNAAILLDDGRRAVSADSLGRFVIDSLIPGDALLSWEGPITSDTFRGALRFTVVAGEGYRATLTSARLGGGVLCPYFGEPSPQVGVRVRTHPDGRPPASAVAIATQHGQRDSAMARLGPRDTVLWVPLFRRWSSPQGGLTVHVESPGYYPWDARDLEFAASRCGGLAPRVIDAWLIPR